MEVCEDQNLAAAAVAAGAAVLGKTNLNFWRMKRMNKSKKEMKILDSLAML